LAVAGSTLALAEGAALEEAEELGVLLADGEEPAFSASVTTRPWVVAEADGVTEDEEDGVALSSALPEALLEALGDGLDDAAAPETSVVSTGRK
jgi:hypothetical protein